MMKVLGKKGFTLIEMISVVAIIGILTTVGVVAFLRNRQSADLDRSASELASNIRKIQGYTRAGRSEGANVPRAYGLMIDLTGGWADTYTLYADFGTSGDDFYFEPAPTGPDVQIDNFTLASNTRITSVEISNLRESFGRIDFGFFVPSSDLKAMGTSVGGIPPDDSSIFDTGPIEVKITVTHAQANKSKVVRVNGGSLGGATVEDGS